MATAFVPEIAQCPPSRWEELERIVGRALDTRPAGLRRQIVLFIRVIEALSVLRFGRGLAALNPSRRTALLQSLASSRFVLIRRGVWGLRTLVMMGYYAQPEVQEQIGYRATAAGWERVR